MLRHMNTFNNVTIQNESTSSINDCPQSIDTRHCGLIARDDTDTDVERSIHRLLCQLLY